MYEGRIEEHFLDLAEDELMLDAYYDELNEQELQELEHYLSQIDVEKAEHILQETKQIIQKEKSKFNVSHD